MSFHINNQQNDKQAESIQKSLSQLQDLNNAIAATNELNTNTLNQIKELANLTQHLLDKSSVNTLQNTFMLHTQVEHFLDYNKHHKDLAHLQSSKEKSAFFNKSFGQSQQILKEIENLLTSGISQVEDIFKLIKLFRELGFEVPDNILKAFEKEVSSFLKIEATEAMDLEDYLSMFSIIKDIMLDLNLQIENEESISDTLTIQFENENITQDELSDAATLDLNLQLKPIEEREQEVALLNQEITHTAQALQASSLAQIKHKDRLSSIEKNERAESQTNDHTHKIEKIQKTDTSLSSQQSKQRHNATKSLNALLKHHDPLDFIQKINNELILFLSKQFPEVDQLLT